MKKILFIVFLISATLFATAQTKPILVTTTSYSKVLDTVLSTATKSTTPFAIGQWKAGLTAQVEVTKISGTVGGSIGLYGSMGGTVFTLIGSAATATDATNSYSFNTTVAWKYFQVKYTGASGQSASFKTYLLPY